MEYIVTLAATKNHPHPNARHFSVDHFPTFQTLLWDSSYNYNILQVRMMFGGKETLNM